MKILLFAATALLLAGCGGGTEVADASGIKADKLLHDTWFGMSQDERDAGCRYYQKDPYEAVTLVIAGINDAAVDRYAATEFLDKACN